MGIFSRAAVARRLPPGMRRPFDSDERILGWATVSSDGDGDGDGEGDGDGDGAAGLVATTRGLWLPGRDERLGWHEIHKATWDGVRLTIIAASEVAAGDGYHVMVDDLPVDYRLRAPGSIPEQVRTRVNRSISYTSAHALPEGGQVRVVARRVSGTDGLRWTVRYADGADPAAAGDATAALVAAARVGMSA